MDTITPFKIIIEQELQRLQSFSTVPHIQHTHRQYDWHHKKQNTFAMLYRATTRTITTVSHFLFQ